MGTETEPRKKGETRKGDVRIRIECDEWDGFAWQRRAAGGTVLCFGSPEDMRAFRDALMCVGLNARGEYEVVGTVKAPTKPGDDDE